MEFENRALIEAARVAGVSTDILAEKHGISRDSIFRHMRKHVSEEVRAQCIADIPIKDLAAKASEEGLALLDYFSIIRASGTSSDFEAYSVCYFRGRTFPNASDKSRSGHFWSRAPQRTNTVKR